MHWYEGDRDVFGHDGYEWVFEPRGETGITLVAVRGIDGPDQDPSDVTLDDLPDAVQAFVEDHDRTFRPQTTSMGAAMGVQSGP